MFRDMRRKNQKLSKEQIDDIMSKATSGVLALCGDNGYPYAVPLSFVYTDDRLYFHCARTGHKLDAIARCDKASFCVISKDDVLPEKYTTLYKSVIAFGKIRVLKTIDEMRQPIISLTKKYVKNDDEGIVKEFDGAKNNMYMLELDIEHISGKQCIELTKD